MAKPTNTKIAIEIDDEQIDAVQGVCWLRIFKSAVGFMDEARTSTAGFSANQKLRVQDTIEDLESVMNHIEAIRSKIAEGIHIARKK